MRQGPLALFAGIILALSSAVLAEAPASPPDDPIGRVLFAPDRVIGHAQEIGLDEGQRAAIKAEVGKAQPKFLDIQFDMKLEMEKLTRLLAEHRVDEAKAMAQLDRILAMERDVKRTQIQLLVRIKNALTPAQQGKLEEIARTGN